MAKSFPNTGATVIDATADLPGSPSEGMMVFQKDTNELKIYDGASWVSMLDTDAPPGCSLLFNTTYGTTSTINIDNVFNSSFRSYKLVYSMVSDQATINNVDMKLRAGGTDLAAGYYNRLWYNDGATATTAHNNNVASCGWAFYHANIISAGTIEFFNPYIAAGKTWTWQGGAFGGSTNIVYQGVSYNGSTSLYDGLSLVSSGGSFISGIIKIYGFRESI
jgi:hypothetical protein